MNNVLVRYLIELSKWIFLCFIRHSFPMVKNCIIFASWISEWSPNPFPGFSHSQFSLSLFIGFTLKENAECMILCYNLCITYKSKGLRFQSLFLMILPVSVGRSGGKSLLESLYRSAKTSLCIPSGRFTAFAVTYFFFTLSPCIIVSLLISEAPGCSISKISRISAILNQTWVPLGSVRCRRFTQMIISI